MRFTAEKKNRLAARTDPAVRATRPRHAASDGGGVGARPASVSTMPRITTPPIASRNSTRTARSEEHTSELQSRLHLVCRLLLEKKKKDLSRFAGPAALQQRSHISSR